MNLKYTGKGKKNQNKKLLEKHGAYYNFYDEEFYYLRLIGNVILKFNTFYCIETWCAVKTITQW